MASLGKILPFLGLGAVGGLAYKQLTAKGSPQPGMPDFTSLLTQAATDKAALLADQQALAKRHNLAAQRNAAMSAQPRSTILTSGSGALGSAPTQKTLLGQ